MGGDAEGPTWAGDPGEAREPGWVLLCHVRVNRWDAGPLQNQRDPEHLRSS